MKKRTQKRRKRQFVEQWKKDKRFKDWIDSRVVGGQNMAWCNKCRKILSPQIRVLKYHAQLHQPEPDITDLSDDQKAKIRWQLALAALVVFKNCSFLFLNYLVPLMK